MAYASVTMPDGRSWIPKFVAAIDDAKCIGCGRCFKVCGRGVLQLMAVNDAGEFIAIDSDDDDDEYEKKVMTIAAAKACIGCEACARTCTKKCISHAAMEV